MNRERQVNTTRREQRPPEPDESRSYTESTTVNENEHAPMKGPPQETGTTAPHD